MTDDETKFEAESEVTGDVDANQNNDADRDDSSHAPRKLKLTMRKTERGGRIIRDDDDDESQDLTSRKRMMATQTTMLPVITGHGTEKTTGDGGGGEAVDSATKNIVDEDQEHADADVKSDAASSVRAASASSAAPSGDAGTPGDIPGIEQKPRLQVRDKVVPPGAEKEPDRKQVEKRRKKKERTDVLHLVGAAVALFFVFVGNVLTAMPTWRQALDDGVLPSQELVVLGIVGIVMALLLFSRRIPLRILAGLLIFTMVCASLVVSFHGGISSAWSVNIGNDILAQFARPTLMLSAAFLFAAAFVLNTGGRVVHWGLSLVFIVMAGVPPFLPETVLATVGIGEALTVPGLDPHEDFDGWKRSVMTASMGTWTSGDGAVECLVRRWSAKEFDSLDAFIEARRVELEEQGFGSPAIFPVPGRDHQVQATLFSQQQRIEMLAVKGEQGFYSVQFKFPRGTYAEYRGFIKQTFANIQ